MLIKTSGIILPKTHPRYNSIESCLHRSVLQFNGGYREVIFYDDLGDSIMIPRQFPIEEPIQDNSVEGEDISIESIIEPRNDRQKDAIQYLIDNPSCILRLEPGSGKTVVTIAAISKIKKKTIIITHKDKLLDQWKGEILKFTNLKETDIGRLYGRNFKKCLEKPIILSTPQTIAHAVTNHKEEFINHLKNSNIGVMVVDEVHVGVGPEKFSKASLNICAKRTYGLSATPSRADGNDDIIKFHFGEIKYFPPSENELVKPQIHMLYFPFGIYSDHKKYICWGGNFNISRYYQQMSNADRYNELVAHWINKAYQKGRNILVLGNRINSLIQLAENCHIDKSDIGIFIPGAKEKKVSKVSDTTDLSDAFNSKRVIFATYGAARDGNNRLNLDTLIMYCMTSNVEQAIGRILRRCDSKKQPIVLDLVDTDGPIVPRKCSNGYIDKCPFFVRSAYKRLEIYEKNKWDVKKQEIAEGKIYNQGESK